MNPVQSFLLSFSVLWRFLIVLPLWAVAYVIFGIVLFFFVPTLFSIVLAIPVVGIIGVPILALLISAMVSLVSIHPYLIATRLGLQVLEIETTSTEKGLLKAAIGYGFVVGLCLSILTFGVQIASDLITGRGMNIARVYSDDQVLNPMMTFAGAITTGNLTVTIVLICLGMMAIRAAALPIFAGAAAGNDPSGQWHTPFNGIGARFLPLMTVLALITCVFAGLFMVLQAVMGSIQSFDLLHILNTAWAQVSGQQPMTFDLKGILFVVLYFGLSIWLFCWQCAAAALSYQDRAEGFVQVQQEQAELRKAEAPDIGELMRSRMPGQNA